MVNHGQRGPYGYAALKTLSRALVFACFFVSGLCSLLYQIVWTRLAFAHFGTITPVLSLIISVFMLGIGLGSFFGGLWIDRLRLGAIYVYAALEASIAVGALVVPLLFDWGESALLRLGESDSNSYLALSAVFIVAAVLPWTFAMGATIPVMMSFARRIDGRNFSTFSFLYAANVLGGMIGALAEAFVLIEIFGIRGTYLLAAFANVGIAVIATLLGVLGTGGSSDFAAGASGIPRQVDSSVPGERRLIPAILFTTGFCSLGLEVVWVRDFTFSLLTTIYAFAAILATYLCATGLGTLAYRWSLGARRTISLSKILGWVFATSLLPVILTDPRLGPSPVRALTSIVPFCALLGFLTPSLIDRAGRANAALTGRYYGINIAGSIAGPLAAGYVLLPMLGNRWAMIVLALPFLALLLAADYRLPDKILATAATLFLAVSIFFSRAYDDTSWVAQPTEVRRDYVATVVARGSGMNKILLVNGFGITALTNVTKVMAHLPMALDARPTAALDICFGMGTTFRSLMSWDVSTTAVDLSKAVIASFGFFHSDAEELLRSGKSHVVVDDGRRYLMRTTGTYDVITIDPPPPVEAAGSSLLYSEEMYRIVKPHLKRGGILQQWIPRNHGPILESVALALKNSFPYLRAFQAKDPNRPELAGTFFIASLTPLSRIGPAEFIARMPVGARRDLMEWEGEQTLKAVVRQILDGEIPLKAILPSDSKVTPLSDDRPFNEYFFLRRHGFSTARI
ncbi:MAG TPA: hypothetical protein VFE36_09400 [Candidatus Baltobacteraceae bacterium]|nr:hypothetical protein [Candidatus Baltobacteraceae bacterium]